MLQISYIRSTDDVGSEQKLHNQSKKWPPKNI